MKKLLFAALIWMQGLSLAFGQSPAVQTEAEILALLTKGNPRVRVLEAEIEAAEADLQAAKTLPNPELGYRREQVSASAGDEVDTFVDATWPLDVSGRRGLARSAAERGVDAAQSLSRWELHSLRADVRSAFYHLLFAQELLQALQETASRFEVAAQTLRSRGLAVNEYDRMRLEREAAEASMEFEKAAAGLKEAQTRLTALIGQPADSSEWRVTGQLASRAISLDPKVLETALPKEHPRLAALLHEADRRQLEWGAARRAWIPALALSGGFKSAETPGERNNGFTAGVSVSVPIFDSGQAAARKKAAKLQQAQGEAALAGHEIRARFQSAYAQAVNTRERLKRYQETILPSAERLEQAAGLGYVEGHRSILELVDAYRGGASARLHALELALEARIAEIELERVLGKEIHE